MLAGPLRRSLQQTSCQYRHSVGRTISATIRQLSTQSKHTSHSAWSRWTPLLGFGVTAIGCGALAWSKQSVVVQCEAPAPVPAPGQCSNRCRKQAGRLRMREAIEQSHDLAQRIKDEVGCPGLVVAVSIDGKEVWSEGLGYSDVENRVPCKANTIMRIASISKPITMMAAARLWEAGKLDIDKPVKEYIPTWPDQTYQGKKVAVTTRQLVSHLGGIRHYEKNCGKKDKKDTENETKESNGEETQDREAHVRNEFEMKEYYIKDKYKSVAASLNLFKDDELCSIPGTEFLYTTHGWTVVSAVIEGASKQKFPEHIKLLFRDLGLKDTYLDDNEPLIYNRSRYYVKNKNGKLENAPYVDNSYKYAGGGFISTASDLCKFANTMLYSYQQKDSDKGGILKAETVKQMWTPVDNTSCFWNPDGGYGMGWCVVPQKEEFGECRQQRWSVNHTGAAIGASSALFILPRCPSQKVESPPAGVAVAMICNVQNAGLNKTAEQIAHIFDKVHCCCQL